MKVSLYKFVSLNYNKNEITFPLYNLSGQLVGYQIYRPLITDKKANDPKTGRYFTYLPRGVDGFFGLEQLDYSKSVCFVTEGIFECANIHRLGHNAITVLGSSPKRCKPFFKILNQRLKLVALGDNDAAGKKLVNLLKLGEQLSCDLDEMPDLEKIKVLQTYSSSSMDL